MEITVQRATKADAEKIVDAMQQAFADEAVSVWVMPDARTQRESAPVHLSHLVDQVLTNGEVLYAGDYAAVSLWLYEDERVDEEPEPLATIPPEWAAAAERARLVYQLTEARHPRGEPHLYLPAMGVLPAHRGTGLGGAMLRHRLARADAAKLPVYLEASTTRNRALYARHGFEDFGDPIELPGGPTIHPMWRSPA
ncbi:GNAT family N-acetyltransferase [Amycolatopsis nigrescens]|uniref:GNAT family N-acetyltransferase n=1 Tax=Amycolatopsis nigrescens TaxID=381445 RepID=UPI00036BCA06|nr:GNAT family N-acetyltransferase [Amycolatopsis nigrescens]